YIRLAGIATEPEPTKNNWVFKDGTCTVSAGSDVSVNVASAGQPHFLMDGRIVRVVSAGTILPLAGNYYPLTSVGSASSSSTFTLNGTRTVAGTTGSCRVAVLADADLTRCERGTAGAIRCTTNVSHGLVSGTVVKVIGD